jgi:transcriptional regulator GlxA family with amidase domain
VHTVALVVFDRIPAFEMAVPCEVFGTDRSAAGLPNYRLLVCAVEPGPLRAAGGITIEAPFGLPDLREADTIVVPAWRDPDEVPPDALLDALREGHRRGFKRAVGVSPTAHRKAFGPSPQRRPDRRPRASVVAASGGDEPSAALGR